MIEETKKILKDNNIRVTATTVRYQLNIVIAFL